MNESPEREAEIFNAARRVPVEQRSGYLEMACTGNSALRRSVEELLGAYEQTGDFLEAPAVGVERQHVEQGLTADKLGTRSALTEQAGDRIGRYKLLQQIGEGGCGVVYMAEQEVPVRRQVALKVIKLGMDTKQVIARFEAERQALALMDHPNIAKVLDAGATETGRPYFVMELVRGIKITDYCDQNNLSTQARLELFVQVCRAVQHAHQKGIIHRDLKPSNILVTINDAVPVPKVIDFGIAKAAQGRLTDSTLFTAFEQFIGTPAYMSPEQAVMTSLDIDTRSDIYSLGVLLYELLTGKTPFDSQELLRAGLDEMRRIIREKEPTRPSTRVSTLLDADLATLAQQRHTDPPKLIHALQGDLDWIVMKALEKERGRRYPTANGLGMDVERYLRDQPVVARPPSRLYLMQKLVRRNKLAVAAAGTVTLALIIGLGLSTWMYFQERKERRHALDAEALQSQLRRRAETASAETEAALEASDFSQAVRLCAENSPADAVPYLARILAANPTNTAALTRLTTLLTYHSWMVPTLILNHSNWVYSARFSPDGRRVVTASYDGTARVWDAQNGLPLTAPFTHKGWVEAAEFSPDGERVATGGDDGNAWVWDAQSGQALTGPLKHDGAVYSAHFSPDGTRIVTASADGTARLWDTFSGQSIGNVMKHNASLQLAQFSPDGRWIVTASFDSTARVWDAKTGRPVTGPLQHARPVLCAEFSPDSKRIVTASWDETARVWDAQTGLPLTGALKHEGLALSGQFSPDGKWVVTTAMDKTARLWDALTGQALTPPMRHDSTVRLAQFTSDGDRLVTASMDGTARVWDARSGLPLTEPLKHGGPLLSARFSPGCKRIVTASADGTARVWDVLGSQPLNQTYRHQQFLRSAEFSPDGRRIVTASDDSTARVWDALNGTPITAPLQHEATVWSAQFSPDGRQVVTASEDHTARVWDAQTGRKLATLKHDDRVLAAEFGPDGKWIATASDDGTARLWDAASGQPLTEPLRHGGSVIMVQFSPDGERLLTASADKTAVVWDAHSGRPLIGPLRHDGPLRSARFSRDGKRIVTASEDRTARVWDAQTGRPLTGPLRHPADVVTSAQFSPDGKRVVTASWDHTARVWDAETGLPLTPPMKHGEVISSARFSPDGKRVVTASDDKTACVWDVETGLPLTEPLEHGGPVVMAQFSPDGKRIVTASDESAACVWDLAPARAKCPDWLPPLAEAISGQTLNKRGMLEETKLNRVETLKLIRERLDQEPGDAWVAWGKWFLAESPARTISPFSEVTFRQYLAHRLEENTAEALEEVKKRASLTTAESMCRETLRESLNVWPNESIRGQCSLSSLVAVLLHQGKFDEAAQVFNDVLKPSGPPNLLINGSFEFGGFVATDSAMLVPGACNVDSMNLNPGAGNITGWTVVGSPRLDLEWIGPRNLCGVSAAEGAYFLDLTGIHDSVPYDGVAQTIRTEVGRNYALSFAVGSDARFDGSTLPCVAVSVTGNPTTTCTVSAVGSNRWQNFTFTFTAAATQTTLTFTGANTNNLAYIGLDNAVVTAVAGPENPTAH